jgi:hypothetical protein
LARILSWTGPRQCVPYLIRRLRAVEQQRRARCRPAEHVDPVQQAKVMAADEAGLVHQVGRAAGYAQTLVQPQGRRSVMS